MHSTDIKLRCLFIKLHKGNLIKSEITIICSILPLVFKILYVVFNCYEHLTVFEVSHIT
jgi:hypothetical protein